MILRLRRATVQFGRANVIRLFLPLLPPALLLTRLLNVRSASFNNVERRNGRYLN